MLQMYTLFQNLHRCRAFLPLRLLPDAASCCQLCLQLLPDAALPLLASLLLFPLAPRPATALSRRLSQQHLPDAAALSSMQGLPRSGNSSAQTSASLHPPAALRLRCLPFTRTWSSTVCAEEFPTPLEMSLHGLHLLRQTQICRPICTDCLRHLRISAR